MSQRTIYEPENADFSNSAHMAARRLLYPKIFHTSPEKLTYEDTLLHMSERGRVLDGEMGVDRIVRVTVPDLHAPLIFTIQERFRRPKFSKYKDLTITEWNSASDLPSELYKINAGIFLYGYYDEKLDKFIDAIAISVTDLLISMVKNQITYSKGGNKKQQSFFAFKFNDLKLANVVIYWLDQSTGKLDIKNITPKPEKEIMIITKSTQLSIF